MTNGDRYVLLAERMEARAQYHEDLARRWRELKGWLLTPDSDDPAGEAARAPVDRSYRRSPGRARD